MFYLFAETGEAAKWVKNIRRNPKATIRIGERQIGATARVLDRHADRELWDRVAAIADRKYGWSDGLPVEITPLPTHWPTPAAPTPSREWSSRFRACVAALEADTAFVARQPCGGHEI